MMHASIRWRVLSHLSPAYSHCNRYASTRPPRPSWQDLRKVSSQTPDNDLPQKDSRMPQQLIEMSTGSTGILASAVWEYVRQHNWLNYEMPSKMSDGQRAGHIAAMNVAKEKLAMNMMKRLRHIEPSKVQYADLESAFEQIKADFIRQQPRTAQANMKDHHLDIELWAKMEIGSMVLLLLTMVIAKWLTDTFGQKRTQQPLKTYRD